MERCVQLCQLPFSLSIRQTDVLRLWTCCLTDVELRHFWLHSAGTNKANAPSHTFIWVLHSELQSRCKIALLSVSKVDWLCAECIKGAYRISSYEKAEFNRILPRLLDVSSNQRLQCGHETANCTNVICLEFHVKCWHACFEWINNLIRQLLSLPPEIGIKILYARRISEKTVRLRVFFHQHCDDC